MKYKIQHLKMLLDGLEKEGNVDIIEWIMLGNHAAKNSEEETAFQCFELAHLMDHKRVRTNADL